MQTSSGHLRSEDEHRDSSSEGSWARRVWQGLAQLRAIRCTVSESSTASIYAFWTLFGTRVAVKKSERWLDSLCCTSAMQSSEDGRVLIKQMVHPSISYRLVKA